MTGPEKTGLIYTKYTYLYYGAYLFFCVCYPHSVSFIEFLRILCIYGELCVKILFCHDEILHFKDRNLGQILHVDKTCFLRPGHIYSVNGYIGDTPVNFLVDSGAALSVVHYNLVKDMQLTQTSHCAVGANGSPLDVVGQIMVTITLGDFMIGHNFVVVRNLTVDCLLGADFMKHYAAVLDCDHNTLSLGRESKVTVPLTLNHQPVLCKASRAVHLVRIWKYLQGLYNLLLDPLTMLQSCLWNHWIPFLTNYM